MSKPLGDALPDAAIAYLVGGNPVVLATVDAEGAPYVSPLGSCIAMDAHTVRFASFSASTTLLNLRTNPRVFIETLGNDLVVGMSGQARIIKEPMAASAFPPHHYAMVEVTVDAVKDDLPPGTRIIGMRYDFDYSRQPKERVRRRGELVDEMRATPMGTADAGSA